MLISVTERGSLNKNEVCRRLRNLHSTLLLFYSCQNSPVLSNLFFRACCLTLPGGGSKHSRQGRHLWRNKVANICAYEASRGYVSNINLLTPPSSGIEILSCGQTRPAPSLKCKNTKRELFVHKQLHIFDINIQLPSNSRSSFMSALYINSCIPHIGFKWSWS